ncbi:MAG: carboxypeptidase-like regulatory domain-containing protein [Flavobacteriaceae bacterium]|nr:carboxypeptidase-like regulatory domain-containing protein [Flavobacteriaceae bacterium]
MKKHLFLLFFFLFTVTFISAQITIQGKVLDSQNKPLEGASVYLNNTSIGTTTNDEGKFELVIKEGVHEIIVSYLGYETLQYQLDTSKPNKPLTFKTRASANLLDEIVLNNKKYSKEKRAHFMSRFKRSFIGRTNLSKRCRILNPEVIQFDYNELSHVLEAYVSKPIEVLNKDLGYKIYYDLIHFELTHNKITYLGYTRYVKLKGGRGKQRKWKKNRLRAYNGSQMHFIRSIMNNTFSKEGFIVDQSKRIPNPERPSDSVLKKTRKYLRNLQVQGKPTGIVISSKNTSVSFATDKNKGISSTALEFKRDSALFILRKARLKKLINMPVKKKLSQGDFVIRSGYSMAIKFQYYLDIRYVNEEEEDNYRRGSAKLKHQASILTLFTEYVELDKAGIFIQPLDVFVEGYWSYEKIADLLPLDYYPEN